jgi:hypothetical protein
MPAGYLDVVAITSEQIWDAPALPEPPPDDAFVFGEPFDPDRLPYRIDLSRTLRRATQGFFAERDPDRPIGVTLAKVLGVVVALVAIAMVTFGVVAALGLWTIKALLG